MEYNITMQENKEITKQKKMRYKADTIDMNPVEGNIHLMS